MGLKDIGATLPPGFRFNPSDEELICHYLYKKIVNEEVSKGTLMEIDLHTCEPWQLPEMSKLNASEWYFFSFRDRKYATGYRTNRATTYGYWKATGKDRTVHDHITFEVVGMRKTLVFYLNRAPNGIKTGWIMHEFRLESPHTPPKEDWVLCRVFYKSMQGETTSASSSICTRPPNTFQNTLKPNVASSPPNEHPKTNKITIPIPPQNNRPPNTFQNTLKPNVASSPPNEHPKTNKITIPIPPQNNNSTFHKHSIVLPCEYQQPQISMPLNPNSVLHHLALESNPFPTTPMSIGAVQDRRGDSDNKDDDCLKFLWELKEDDHNAMDVVSTLEDQLEFELGDNSMILFP